jgi:5-methylthioribose kinase
MVQPPESVAGMSHPPASLVAAMTEHLRRLGLLVVKAALPRLRVAEEWLADPARALFEARALRVVGDRLPSGDVPRVLFTDADHALFGMVCAPKDAVPWKMALLQGTVNIAVARQVGALLGRLHAATWEDAALAREFAGLALFEQLRLQPYHERTAQVAEARGEPDLAALLRAGAAQMREGRTTLVHGDFSPKNLLIHAGGVVCLDFEVAHWGNPDFDTAFLLTHLALKAIHRPDAAAALRAAAEIFLSTYAEVLGHRSLARVREGAVRQAGCLLLARADGKSPAEYLDEHGRARARALGAGVLRGAVREVAALFNGGEG